MRNALDPRLAGSRRRVRGSSPGTATETPPGTRGHATSRLRQCPPTRYGVDSVDDEPTAIDTATAQASVVGPLGMDVANIAMDFAPAGTLGGVFEPADHRQIPASIQNSPNPGNPTAPLVATEVVQ